MQNQTQSPFETKTLLVPRVSLMMLLVLMVVASCVFSLAALAMQVPVINAEVRAYLGMTQPISDTEDARKVHLNFLLALYSAPLALGVVVSLIHFAASWYARRKASVGYAEERTFIMSSNSHRQAE